MTTTKQKVLVIIGGLIIGILVLEVSLRSAGFIYKTYRTNEKFSIIKEDKNTIKILSLGDSFTFGEGAPKGYSYPEQLQIMLNRNPSKKFIVYNGGIPGTNSSLLFKNLESNIQKYNPDVIIVMTGANNNSNFMQSNYFLFIDKSIKTRLYRLDAFLDQMCSYKLYKFALINFYNKIKPKLKQEYLSVNHNFLNIAFNKKNKYKMENLPRELKEKAKKHLELAKVYEKQTQVNLALAECKKVIELNPYNAEAYYFLGFLYLHRCADLYNDANLLAIQAFKKSVELDPLNESTHENLFNAYYHAGKKNLALEELKIIHKLNPIHPIASLINFYGIPEYKGMEAFEKMLKYDLKNIIRLTVSQRLKLILQSYPGCWANATLREIAKNNKIPFVDNQAIFEKIASSEGYKRQDYYAEDGHCNANGYRVMAENIYNVLISESEEKNLK